MLFYFSDTEPIILPADGDIEKEIGMSIHSRLFLIFKIIGEWFCYILLKSTMGFYY